ncbi:hypothetical protein LZ30DRAFT_727509 [Colletotrichum cereale]|nr:hypothetical protein LZ30DRAFT_727509 [Colletotrichum cereale]
MLASFRVLLILVSIYVHKKVSTCRNSQPPIARCLSGSFHSCPHLLSGALSSLIRSFADLSQSRDGWMPQATHMVGLV